MRWTTTQCLTDEATIKHLAKMTGDANDQFPDFKGTPSFLINGTMVENTATWDKLEPELKKALGG